MNKPKVAAVKLILISLAFATMILFSSWLMRGFEHRMTVTYLLIALWWIPFSYYSIPDRRECFCGKVREEQYE